MSVVLTPDEAADAVREARASLDAASADAQRLFYEYRDAKEKAEGAQDALQEAINRLLAAAGEGLE